MLKRLPKLLGLLLASTLVGAYSEDLYKVEIIAFTQQGASIPSAAPSQFPSHEGAIELKELAHNGSSAPALYQILPKTELSLLPQAKALGRRNQYEVLLHIAWLQDFSQQKRGADVHIYAGKRFDTYGEPVAQASSIYQLEGDLSSQTLSWELDGSIRIKRSNFFDVSAVMRLLRPVNADQHPTQLSQYQLKQTGRIRSNELYYFDHPNFGLIAYITPYEVNTFVDEIPGQAAPSS